MKKLTRRWLPTVLLALLLSAACLFVYDHLPVSQAQGQYVPPTAPPFEQYPGPTIYPTSPPYPGVPTITPQLTPPAGGTPTSPLSATPTISGTLTVTGTLGAAQPTLDLLFPGDVPQTPSATPVIIYVKESSSTGTALGPPARLLIVIVIVLWGLLGTFLVVYIRRLGY